MKKTIKILLTALTVALLACLLCMALSAESSGNCGSDGEGSNLTWELDDEGTLTIDGSGAMKSYSYGNAPWFSAVGGKPVKKVVIKSGCTSIGSYAFQSSSTNYIESVSLPDTLRTIGSDAFFLCKSLTEINIPSSVTNIYYFAFDGCSALEELTLSEGGESHRRKCFFRMHKALENYYTEHGGKYSYICVCKLHRTQENNQSLKCDNKRRRFSDSERLMR